MIRILFLAANPLDRDRLRLRQEFDEVRRALDAAAHGQRFDIIQEFAVAPGQLQELCFRHRPQIVHFSGHGMADGLVFEDGDGAGQMVAAAPLRDLFAGFQNTVRCVVLNACYSQIQAEAIGTVIDTVVGMSDALTDDAALAFAGSFYRALANGTTLAEAMDLGRNQLDLQMLDEADKPQLLAERIDASQVRALAWDDDLQQPDVAKPRGIFGLYPFNEHFFGRDDELATLHTLLQSEPNVSICPIITGMGGLGKTQLAAHYARAHISDYPDGIFWITAADLNSICPQLADFCVALNLPVADPQRAGDLTEQKISAFKAYLDQHPQALLIFDNVAEPDHLCTRQIGLGFTALTLGGKVLVTTRRRKLSGDRFAELPLERLLPAPARQILTTSRPDLADDPDLDRLCEQFGYLPLMLNLAAAALRKRGGAIAGYLVKLQEWGIDTLHDRAKVSLDDYHTSLTAVLQEQWAMLTSEDARLLLRVAGQLPEAEVIPTARLGLLAGLRDVDEWECPLRYGLEELERVSLVEMVDGETVRLHPLIRDFAETLLDAHERAIFRNRCVQQLADTYASLSRVIFECTVRNVTEVISDLDTAINLLNLPVTNSVEDYDWTKTPDRLYLLRRILNLEAPNLQATHRQPQSMSIRQQINFRATSMGFTDVAKRLPHHLPLNQHQYLELVWSKQVMMPELEFTLLGEIAWVMDIGISVHDKRIVSATSVGKINIWNWTNFSLERTLNVSKYIVGTVAVSGNNIIAGGYDGKISIWNLESLTCEHIINAHDGMISSIAVFDKGKRFISVSYDQNCKVWNLQTYQLEYTLIGHTGYVNDAVIFDDYQLAVTASDDMLLIVWDLVNHKIKHHLRGHTARVLGVTILNECLVASISIDQSICIWDVVTL